MYVNYLKEINEFNRYANDNMLGSGERLLWFGLMDYINLHFANRTDWPGNFVQIPNKRLLSHVPFGEDALIDARNRLKQRGRIEYIPGKKNKEAPQYRVLYFGLSTCYPQDVENEWTSYPEKTGNMPCNYTGNMPGNYTGNMGGNYPDINLNVNVTPNPNVNLYDDADADERAREGARKRAAEAYKHHFGEYATTAEVERIAWAAVMLGMSCDMIDEAIKSAALNHAKTPAAYVQKLLGEWKDEYIFTPFDLDEYRCIQDSKSGKLWSPGFDADKASEEARERRKQRALSIVRAG